MNPPGPGAGRELFGLDGKAAIVTGAGSRGAGIGNGRAAAILLARAGARVGLVDSVREAAEVTLEAIEADGGEGLVVAADVSRSEDCAAAVNSVAEAFGGVDVLVNNVGIAGPGGNAEEVDADRWEETMAVNVSSMMLMAKHAIPLLRLSTGPAIVNVSSGAGLRAGHPALAYATSKGAVIQLSRAMAAHHGEEGIRVNCVAPGAVLTPMVEARGISPEMRERRRLQSLLGVEGTGWDTGMAVLFLASGLARWITGVVLPVDGGYAATGMNPGQTTPSVGEDEEG